MKKLLLLAVVLVSGLFLTGCEYTSSQATESNKQEEIQKKLVQSVPTPQITNSVARESIKKRAELFDATNKTTYIYLVSYGRVMAFYPVKGKVNSLRSYLTPMENIVSSTGELCTKYDGCGSSGYLVSAPDVDGTYGENTDGIFFFTADTGAYVEWKGDYLVSDQPLSLQTQPDLVREIK